MSHDSTPHQTPLMKELEENFPIPDKFPWLDFTAEDFGSYKLFSAIRLVVREEIAATVQEEVRKAMKTHLDENHPWQD